MMRSLIVVAVLLARTSIAALPEIQISKRGSSSLSARSAHHLLKRDGAVTADLAEILTAALGGGYFTTLMVGTPPQPQQVLLDTGASDTYFLTSSTCQTPSSDPSACRGGIFFPNNSASYSIVNPWPAFNITFGDGSSAVGPFARDTIVIGDIAIENVEFGIAEGVDTTTGYSTGILGLGPSANEVSNTTYPNLPEVLKDAGIINSRLFSVYLDEFGSSGSVLFGGIDSSKYSGELVTLDLLPEQGTNDIDTYIVNVTALAISVGSSGLQQAIFSGGAPVNEGTQSNDSALPVLLCIGCGFWELPTAYYDQVIQAFTFIDSNGYCSCDHQNDDHVLQIVFGAETAINVPARDLIVPVFNTTTGKPIAYTDGSDTCIFGFSNVTEHSEYYTMGESVLRSMYLVFDLDNAQVSIAQAVVNSTAPPDIQTVAAGPSGVQQAASRVQPASSNPYSIATAASIDAQFSTFAASSAITSAPTENDTPTVTGGAEMTGTSSTPPSPTSSKGAGAVNTLGTASQSLTMVLIFLAFTVALAFCIGIVGVVIG